MKELTNQSEWDNVVEESRKAPVFIFKHSTSCPVSAEAHKRVQEYLQTPPDDCPPFYLVKVIESRSLSQTIAKDTKVEHQSPQLLLVKDGQGLWSSSHLHISEGAINWALDNHVRD